MKNIPHAVLIQLNRSQTLHVKINGFTRIITGKPETIGSELKKYHNKGCKLVFSTEYSKNEKRTFNAMVKRCARIAEAAGVILSNPTERYENGYRFDYQYEMLIL